MEAILILDNIRSVANVGSIFRTAECFGVKKLILVGTTPAPLDRFGFKRKDLAKVALGAEKLVAWEYEKDIIAAVKKAKKDGFQIISLEQDESSVDLKNFNPEKKFALIVGNEVDGVSKSVLEKSDAIVEIEMKGEKESLNVSVATGVALYELLK